ncbi:MAG TPA: DUF1570 domain-containing protein [Planctomycetaceae bacterium]|nr:DUF1570 domain-containing protein [Planctomycetaceae bacterium]
MGRAVRRLVAVSALLIVGAAWLGQTAPYGVAGASRASRSQKVLRYYQNLHRSQHDRFVKSLQDLAAWCEARGLVEAAAEVRRSIRPFDPDRVEMESLPEKVQPPIDSTQPEEHREWRMRLRRLRKQYARDVYFLSRRVLRAGFPSYAYALVRQVAQADPDHEAARRLLGFERYGDRWVTPFTASMLRRGYVWHERFGWLPEKHVARYEQGERYFRGWIDAKKEAELRRDFRHAWQVRTDHYLVKTNHSLEAGVKLARALEEFYRFFRQTFIAFFNTPEQMQKLFEGGRTSRSRRRIQKPHTVHFYRVRSQYVEQLRDRIPQIEITNGLYLPDDRIIYTFYNPDPEADMRGTLFHEATHQLLYESQSRDRPIANDANFWAVEGIACYMESAQLGPKGLVAGDPRYIRFQTARYRYLEEGFYIPLARFVRMSKTEIQHHPEIGKIYTQASGLAYFFMHYDGGRYRDAFIEHLSQIYNADPRRRHRVASLAELTGVSFDELDQQYGEFLRSLPSMIPPGAVIE